MGVASPGRWHSTQRLLMIGATSFVYVTLEDLPAPNERAALSNNAKEAWTTCIVGSPAIGVSTRRITTLSSKRQLRPVPLYSVGWTCCRHSRGAPISRDMIDGGAGDLRFWRK